ncbi:MAG: hypothetical protein AAF585_07915, partial [Verrucomicrobiota bacterium]
MKKRVAILLIVGSAAVGLMLGWIPGFWSNEPPRLALTQLGELHLNHGNRAEAFTCFAEAYRLASGEETKARCLKGAELAKTDSELVDVIDLEGPLVNWWFDGTRSQLLALSKIGILLYNLANGSEIDRQLFGAEIKVYSSQTDSEIPDWIAVGTADDHVEIYEFPDFASCELARKIETRELFGIPALGSPPNERLAISIMNKGFMLLDPRSGFETEFETDAKNSDPVMSPDGKLLAYFQDRKAQIWNLETQQLQAETILARPSVDQFTFGPMGNRLLALTNDHLEIVDTDTGQILKSVEHRGRGASMVMEDWFPVSGAAYATMSRGQQVKYWNLNEPSFAEIRGPNPALAWHMLTAGASPDQAQELQKTADRFHYYFDQFDEIQIGDAKALIQCTDQGISIRELPDGKAVLHDVKDLFCHVFHWQDEGGILSQLSKNGRITQHLVSHQNGRWQGQELADLQLPVSNVENFVPLTTNRFAVTRLGIPRIE